MPVDRIEALATAWDAGRVPILAPRKVIQAIDHARRDPLPASWDVTSDSIAARIAEHLEARCLILLKSASLSDCGATRLEAARIELVDRMFPHTARNLLRVEYLNLRDPDAKPVLLEE